MVQTPSFAHSRNIAILNLPNGRIFASNLPHFVIECRYFKLGEEVVPQVTFGEA